MFEQKKLKKVVFILIGLIVVTGALGYFYYQRNIFGQDRLRFEIVAPERIEAGEEIEYMLRYKNNSDIRLEEMTLIFEYPNKAIPIEPENYEDQEEVRKRGDFRREVEIGELNPGEERTTTFKARLLGKKGESLEASATIRYVPRNLAARYDSERSHMAVITEVPIDFDFQLPSTVDPEREAGFRLRFSSDIDYPLTDLEIRMRYPAGFSFVRSTPKTDAEGRNEWPWPVLNKGDHGTIDIDGYLRGEPGDAKVFNATLGVWVGERFIPLKETSKGTAISESKLLVDMQVNGEADYVANPGEMLHYEIFFRNVGEETLEDLFLLVDLDDKTLNMSQVEPMDGRFQEERGVIIWSYTFDFVLQSLKANEEGRVEFWARVREDLPYDPEIKVKASIERAEKTLATRVNTRLSLSQDVFRQGSPFEKEGPFPFKEGETSNYAVRWKMDTLFSDVRDVIVKAKLPEGARVTGEKEPEKDISLSFNSTTREVILEIEDLYAGQTKEVFFEVEITPPGDFKEEDMVIGKAQMTAEDKKTNKGISQSAGAVFLDGVIERYDR